MERWVKEIKQAISKKSVAYKLVEELEKQYEDAEDEADWEGYSSEYVVGKREAISDVMFFLWNNIPKKEEKNCGKTK